MMNDLSTFELRDFELREHIGGRWSTPSITLESSLCDPNLGTRLGPMRASSVESLERAMVTTTRIHRSGSWGDRPKEERARCLRDGPVVFL